MPTVFPLHAAFKKLFSLTKTLIPLNVFGNDENLLENAEHTLVKTAHSLTGAWLSLKKATLSPNYFRNYENHVHVDECDVFANENRTLTKLFSK